MYEHKNLIESAVITYLKRYKQFVDLLKEEGDVPDYIINKEPAYTCFGIDVYERRWPNLNIGERICPKTL